MTWYLNLIRFQIQNISVFKNKFNINELKPLVKLKIKSIFSLKFNILT